MNDQAPNIVEELEETPAKKKATKEFGKQFDERGMSYERKQVRSVMWAAVIVVVILGLGVFFIQSGIIQRVLKGSSPAQTSTSQTETTSASTSSADPLPGLRNFENSDAEGVSGDLEADINNADGLLENANLYDSPNWEFEFGWSTSSTATTTSK